MTSLLLLAVVTTTALDNQEARKPIQPYESPGNPTPTKIDRFVFGQLKRLNIQPALVCSDAVFVRRVYLDVIGTLPTSQEARDFISDQNPKKRRVLIDRLLERREFADYWAMKWCDLLRVKSEYPINLWPNAVQCYHRWIRNCIRVNMPYDRFVREMLTAEGGNFSTPPVNFYRAVQSREPAGVAQAVALNFMGVRPEGWPTDRWAAMAVFFSRISYKATDQWKEEIVVFDPSKAAGSVDAVLPDGTRVKLSPEQDPRKVFANWLTTSKNPWFARNIANRAWSWLLGRGIIHEPDDIRIDTPASNPELLAYLEGELVASHYDLKHVFRLILNSNTYQLSSIPGDDNPEGDVCFSHYIPRRLDAEVLIDAICQVTGTAEKYSSPIPEPFTFVPESVRSIQLCDSSISSSFLDIFGRPSRDTGLESERNNRPTAAQSLHLLNSSHIRRKIEEGTKLRELAASNRKPQEMADDIYLMILSRHPTDAELKVLKEYAEDRRTGRRPMIDLMWALINSAEFLYRH